MIYIYSINMVTLYDMIRWPKDKMEDWITDMVIDLMNGGTVRYEGVEYTFKTRPHNWYTAMTTELYPVTTEDGN